jgi:hypothetical protein
MSEGQPERERPSRRVSTFHTAKLGQIHPVHLQLPSDVIQDSAFLPIHKPEEYIKQLWRSWSVDAGEQGTLLSLDRYLQGFVRTCHLVRTSAIKSSQEFFASADFTWLQLGTSPLNHTFWSCARAPPSPFAAFVPESSKVSNRIEVLDSGMVKLCAEVSLITFSSPDRLLFQIGRPMSTYFEVTVMSLNQSISSLSFGFSQPRRASGDSIAIGQPRSACSMLLSSFSITCNGSPVSNLPEDFVALLREHGKQQGTVFGVHLDSAAGCVTFSVAAFASPVASSLSSKPATDAAAAAPANTAKPVPTKLQRHTVQWTPTDRFQPFIELMQGSIHVNSGEAPFLLEVPSGASDLLTQVPKHAHLSPPVATLLAAYRGDKVVSQNCNQAVTSALVAALKHVLSDAPVQLAPLSAQSNATPSFLQAISDYEHDLAVLTNLLQDQEIFSALFRASQEEELKQALSSLPQIAVALGSQVTVSATPGTDDFAQRAASSLFDRSPPPSPRNLSPVPRESRSLSLPDADITQDVFRSRLPCMSFQIFSLALRAHFCASDQCFA